VRLRTLQERCGQVRNLSLLPRAIGRDGPGDRAHVCANASLFNPRGITKVDQFVSIFVPVGMKRYWNGLQSLKSRKFLY
jgi:hypothetical protein